MLSLIMIAAVYGIQALVFFLRRRWDMVGWMFFYILAIPAFSFFLPLYSFWRMHDFSWGQTRVVLGESGKKLIVHVSVALVSCSDKGLNIIFRMKETLILVPYRSSLGMIMSVFWYITFL